MSWALQMGPRLRRRRGELGIPRGQRGHCGLRPEEPVSDLGFPGIWSEAGKCIVWNCGNVTFEFAVGGTQSVTLEVNGAAYTASFSVQVPQDVTVTATPTPPATVQLKTNPGMLVRATVDTPLVPRPFPSYADHLSMEYLAWKGSTPAGWQYCFAQTASFFTTYTVNAVEQRRGRSERRGVRPSRCHCGIGWRVSNERSNLRRRAGNKDAATIRRAGIIKTFIWATRSAGRFITVAGYWYAAIQATTYYMCRPVVNGVVVGGWVPTSRA